MSEFHVFPVDGKLPMVKWRQESKPRDQWTGWPATATGYGIDCGKSGIVVVDEDEPGAVKAWLGYEPDTFTVSTGRGSHSYFTAPQGVTVRCKTAIAPGVDVKADGGYVVGPDSVHTTGVIYSVVNEAPIAPLPPDLLALLTMPKASDYLDVLSPQDPDYPNTEEGTTPSPATQTKDYIDKLDRLRSTARKGRRLQVTRASEIVMKRVAWAWKTASGGRMPAGELAIVAGQPGRGKSTKVNHLGAQMTRGTLPGKFYGQPRSIIVSATEESWETTIVPKLAASGADLERVLRVETLVYMAEAGRTVSVGLNLDTDIAALEDLMVAEDVGMLILDPIISRLGKLDTHKDAEVRVALDPLVEVLHNTGAVGVGIMHFNKGQGDALKLLMGSTAFGAVARSVHVVEKDPDNPGQRLLATVKANMGRDDLPMVRFRLEEATVQTEDGPAAVAVAVDMGEDDSGRSFEDVQRRVRRDSLSAERQASGVRTVIDEAVEFLADWMRSHNYSGKSSEIKAAAKELDIPEMTLKRARARLRITVSSREGFGGPTYWTWTPELERGWGEGGGA